MNGGRRTSTRQTNGAVQPFSVKLCVASNARACLRRVNVCVERPLSAVACVLVLLFTASRFRESAYSARGIALTYDVCGGFSNRLLSSVYATTFAISLGFSEVVVPSVPLDDTREDAVDAKKHDAIAEDEIFEKVFDLRHLAAFLARHGVRLRRTKATARAGETLLCASDASLSECVRALRGAWTRPKAIHLECPFMTNLWDTKFIERERVLFQDVLSQYRASVGVRTQAERAVKAFMKLSKTKCLHAAHLRIEDGWSERCRSRSRSTGAPYDECYVEAERIFAYASEIRAMECDTYLAYEKSALTYANAFRLTEALKRVSVKTFTFDDLVESSTQSRDVQAAIEYEIATRFADKFLGNSVSTFSALIIRERRLRKAWAAQYNRGGIPLSRFVPGFRIPWVLIASGVDAWRDRTMRIAVESALRVGEVLPICITHADEAHFERVEWLRRRNITVVIHRPAWEAAFRGSISRPSAEGTPLTRQRPLSVGTFLRIDLGVIPELFEFEHVLFADTQVFFRRPVDMFASTREFPRDVRRLEFEARSFFPRNARVYAASMPFLRSTYEGMLNTALRSGFVLDSESAARDCGAMDALYETYLANDGDLDVTT